MQTQAWRLLHMADQEMLFCLCCDTVTCDPSHVEARCCAQCGTALQDLPPTYRRTDDDLASPHDPFARIDGALSDAVAGEAAAQRDTTDAAWYRYIVAHFTRHHEGGGWYFNSYYLKGKTLGAALEADKQHRAARELR